jgi:peptidyl-tRNA hydrolase
MYVVVRKDHPITTAEGMALAGAGSVRCADRYRATAEWADAFRSWGVRPRKVALRADAEQLESLRTTLACEPVESPFGITLLTFPPRLRSASEPALQALRPYTDPPRRGRDDAGVAGGDEPAEGGDAGAPGATIPLRYVVRPGVIKTTGKAMAQAGHAAMMCADRLTPRHPEAFAAWREAGAPGEVRVATDLAHWALLRESPASVVVADAGLTQVEPGTETVIGVAPIDDVPPALLDLPLL